MYRADVNKADRSGCSPLLQASFAGHIEVVEMLLLCGARVNCSDTEGEDTPLNAAARRGKIEV